MRFTFGPTNRFSTLLYMLGIPVVLIMFLDRTLSWQLTNEQLNLQLFFAGAIVVTLAALINLVHTILENYRGNKNY